MRKFDPVLRMIISRDSGLLNDYFSITKGQLIDLYAFASYEGEEGCNTEETYPEGEPTPIKDLTFDVPYIHNVKEMRAWMHPLYIIEDYTKDYETYKVFQQKLYNIIRGCYTIQNCRNAMVRFKFTKGYHIILGSGSPRRKELLGELGLKFEVDTRNTFEEVYSEDTPQESIPEVLSMGKSLIVYGKISNFEQMRSRIESITAEDLQQVALDILKWENLNTLIYN